MSNSPVEHINVKNLGRISSIAEHKVKFILLDNGVLLFGKVEWHKDLMDNYLGDESNIIVIAAGSIPTDIETADLEDSDWGGWKSTGYKVLTPPEYRAQIRDALLPYRDEITKLLK